MQHMADVNGEELKDAIRLAFRNSQSKLSWFGDLGKVLTRWFGDECVYE